MRKTTKQRFFERIDVTPGCWNWTGFKDYKGYGKFYVNGKIKTAQRFSYEFYAGKVPEGKEVDHICRNRGCVNPQHLRAVTHAMNMFYARKEFCKNGHSREEQNLGNGRHCKLCNKERNDAYRNAHPEEAADYMRKYAKKNKIKLRDYQREYMRKYRAKKRAACGNRPV